MKSFKYFLLFFSCLFFNCNEDLKLEYKYADRENVISCEGIDTNLFEEALITFEEDLFKKYDAEQRMYNRAYSRFIGDVVNNNVNAGAFISEYTLNVLNELKKDASLWDLNNKNSKLNHKHKIIACISKNIKDEDLKETFNALVNANSLSLRMFVEPLKKKTATIKQDRYLALFIALDYFYANLYDVDFTIDPKTKPETVQLN